MHRNHERYCKGVPVLVRGYIQRSVGYQNLSGTPAQSTAMSGTPPRESSLFTPFQLGNLALANRMVMAPMTRCRAIGANIPGPLAVIYYTQRASAGLIITEGSQVSPQGIGFIRTPGIHSPEQVEGWRAVTESVHGAGGKIFLQLWHVGRMSHPDFLGGELPVAPSALPVNEEIHVPGGKKPIPVPGPSNPLRSGTLSASSGQVR